MKDSDKLLSEKFGLLDDGEPIATQKVETICILYYQFIKYLEFKRLIDYKNFTIDKKTSNLLALDLKNLQYSYRILNGVECVVNPNIGCCVQDYVKYELPKNILLNVT